MSPCKYCGQPIKASPEARRQNPYCSTCLNERLDAAAAKSPVVRWDRRGAYAFPIRDEGTGANAIPRSTKHMENLTLTITDIPPNTPIAEEADRPHMTYADLVAFVLLDQRIPEATRAHRPEPSPVQAKGSSTIEQEQPQASRVDPA